MRPFEGIRIIDATHVLAGPFGTYQLATLGADVVKVEPPDDPDQTRFVGGDLDLRRRKMGTWFLGQGANKRCLTLDLKNPAGKDVFRRLLQSADVLVENYRPGAFAALGFDADTVAAINPRLIYCSMSAFGQTGPRAGQTAYDNVIQALSGLMAITGTPESSPIKVGSPVVDYATGISAAFAISAALLQRERTQKGQRIDLAMFDVALVLMALHVTGFRYEGNAPRPSGNRGPFPTVGCYETREGLLMLGASNHRQQRRLWNALERPDMIKTGDAALSADRRPEIEVLAQVLRTKSAAEWEAFLQARHVPAARVRTMEESLEDPQLDHRRVFQTLAACAGVDRDFTVPLAPFVFGHGGPSVETAPREPGADTAGILAELGYSDAEVQTLRDARAV